MDFLPESNFIFVARLSSFGVSLAGVWTSSAKVPLVFSVLVLQFSGTPTRGEGKKMNVSRFNSAKML